MSSQARSDHGEGEEEEEEPRVLTRDGGNHPDLLDTRPDENFALQGTLSGEDSCEQLLGQPDKTEENFLNLRESNYRNTQNMNYLTECIS